MSFTQTLQEYIQMVNQQLEEGSKETSGYREVLITEISDFYKITNLMKEKD